jgi:hypothetical protein
VVTPDNENPPAWKYISQYTWVFNIGIFKSR